MLEAGGLKSDLGQPQRLLYEKCFRTGLLNSFTAFDRFSDQRVGKKTFIQINDRRDRVRNHSRFVCNEHMGIHAGKRGEYPCR